jgi:lysophospholipase L1-like esterase
LRLVRLLFRVIKGLYDLLASYLLAWILFFALVAWGFQAILGLVVGLAGHSSTESFWIWADRRLELDLALLRVIGFGLLHLGVFLLLRRRLRWVQGWLERGVDRVLARYRRWAKEHARGRAVTGGAFSLIVTALLVPFVVQPTLVPLRHGFTGRAWLRRAANLADGSATAAAVESVIGLYRKLYAEPVVSEGVTGVEFDDSWHEIELDEVEVKGEIDDPDPVLPGPGPMPYRRRPLMDRWDPLLKQVVKGDRRAFAAVKAFMWVESGGQQFAVSHTGCAGLMQFASRTARTGFSYIFGRGQIYPCSCRGARGCSVPRSVRKALESGDPARVMAQQSRFPCDLTDARFNPRKSLTAGWAFIGKLQRTYGGNIYLSYIGYNSGPAVAQRLWRAIGKNSRAGLDVIAPQLPRALEPYYGAAASTRARSLLRVHLPKLGRAYRLYLRQVSAPPSERALVRPQPLELPPEDAFSGFFARLSALQERRARRLRISVWGDSHVAAEVLPAQLRRRFQARFGDGGPGFVLLGKPWPSYRHSQVETGASRGWRAERLWGRYSRTRPRPRDDLFGVAGISVHSRRAASTWVRPVGRRALAGLDLFYLRQPGGGTVEILADGTRLKRLRTAGARRALREHLDLPGRIKRLDLSARRGEVRLFGVDLHSGRPGVVVDSLGINGAQASSILKWNELLLARHLEQLAPDLVILAYGSNEVDAKGLTRQTFAQDLDAVLERMSEAAPNASCLVVGPPDQARQLEGQGWRVPGRLDYLVAEQRRLARERGCAFWDQRAAMGAGNIFAWVRNNLARGDHLHMSVRGYRQIGDALYRALIDAWKRR